jgi:hypothetical protein
MNSSKSLFSINRRTVGRWSLAIAILPLLAASSHAALSTPAKSAASIATADDKRNAFALGYVLENSHQSAFEFIDAVKKLRDVNDDAQAGSMVDSLTVRGEAVRRQEYDSFRRATDLLKKLHAATASISWAEHTATGLAHPIEKGPRGVESEELVTEHLSAIIDETGRVQKEMLGALVHVLPGVRSRYGASAVWAFDAGTFDAKVKHWSGDVADIPLLRKEAAHLVSKEPAGTPADVDGALRAILPGDSLPTLQKGRGNLSALLPESSIHEAAVALRAVPDILSANYNAVDLVKQTDDVK